MKNPLRNRVALITGAASGLGRQLACDLASRGVRLVLADKDQVGLDAAVAEISGNWPEVVGLKADVTRESDCRKLVTCAARTYGRLDFLILSAGVSMWARFDQVTDLEILRHLIEVNYLGAAYCIHAALPNLKEHLGTIVAISSLQGEVGIPQHTGYSASKHALNGLLEALDLELGGQVRILNVMPGWITGTNLRASAFQTVGHSGGHGARSGMASVSVQECSRLIILAMQQGAGRLFIPGRLRGLLWLKALAPGVLRALIARAVAAQEKD